MDWFKIINSFYKSSAWTKDQVADAVTMGKITETQYQEITGEPYQS